MGSVCDKKRPHDAARRCIEGIHRHAAARMPEGLQLLRGRGLCPYARAVSCKSVPPPQHVHPRRGDDAAAEEDEACAQTRPAEPLHSDWSTSFSTERSKPFEA